MADEHVPNKPVHLIYLCGGLLTFYLLQWTTEWIWGYFTRNPSEFYITAGSALGALVLGIIFYKNKRAYTLVSEVADQLSKVTWPTSQETKMATIVVIIMTIISALVLGLFDFVFKQLSQLIYS